MLFVAEIINQQEVAAVVIPGRKKFKILGFCSLSRGVGLLTATSTSTTVNLRFSLFAGVSLYFSFQSEQNGKNGYCKMRTNRWMHMSIPVCPTLPQFYYNILNMSI